MYKISIIVPVYNKEKYVEECIQSLLMQSYENLEIILVDDESTDNSKAICDRYAGEHENITVIHQKNAGPTAACVTGMHAARGEYYMFVDGDDYLDAETLTRMSECLEGVAGEVVCCNHILEKQKNVERVSMGIEPGVYTGAELYENIQKKLIGEENRLIPMSRCMKLCEKSIFEGNEKYYRYQVRFGDDLHLMYPAMLRTGRVVIMKDAFFYHYRYVEDSIVHGYDRNIFASTQAVIASLAQAAADILVKGEKPVNRDGQSPMEKEDFRSRISREYTYMLLYILKNELRNPGADYFDKIRQIFGNPEVRRTIENTPVTVNGMANRLMYFGAKHPNRMVTMLLRVIMKCYDHL